jgi:hypothetical protein
MVAAMIRERFNLPEEDVRPVPMSSEGADIQLSNRARLIFPFAVECKNQERLNIWEAIKQAKKHGDNTCLTPLVVFTRNREDVYVSLPLEDFMDLVAICAAD